MYAFNNGDIIIRAISKGNYSVRIVIGGLCCRIWHNPLVSPAEEVKVTSLISGFTVMCNIRDICTVAEGLSYPILKDKYIGKDIPSNILYDIADKGSIFVRVIRGSFSQIEYKDSTGEVYHLHNPAGPAHEVVGRGYTLKGAAFELTSIENLIEKFLETNV